MTEFISKHSIKIQYITIIAVLGFIIYWTFSGAGYLYRVDTNTKTIQQNTQEIRGVKTKLDTLATKQDLQILKQDIKDFIK